MIVYEKTFPGLPGFFTAVVSSYKMERSEDKTVHGVQGCTRAAVLFYVPVTGISRRLFHKIPLVK